MDSVIAGGTFRRSDCCWSGSEVCSGDLSLLGHGNGTDAQNLSVKTTWECEGGLPLLQSKVHLFNFIKQNPASWQIKYLVGDCSEVPVYIPNPHDSPMALTGGAIRRHLVSNVLRRH